MAQRPIGPRLRTTTGPETEEMFLADRQRFWLAWTRFTLWVAVLVAIVLILMVIFLV